MTHLLWLIAAVVTVFAIVGGVAWYCGWFAGPDLEEIDYGW